MCLCCYFNRVLVTIPCHWIFHPVVALVALCWAAGQGWIWSGPHLAKALVLTDHWPFILITHDWINGQKCLCSGKWNCDCTFLVEFKFWMVVGETEVQSRCGQLVTENTGVYDFWRLKSSNCVLRHCFFQMSTFQRFG